MRAAERCKMSCRGLEAPPVGCFAFNGGTVQGSVHVLSLGISYLLYKIKGPEYSKVWTFGGELTNHRWNCIHFINNLPQIFIGLNWKCNCLLLKLNLLTDDAGDGKLFQWGCGRSCGSTKGNILSPEEVTLPDLPVKDIAGGCWHSLLLTGLSLLMFEGYYKHTITCQLLMHISVQSTCGHIS